MRAVAPLPEMIRDRGAPGPALFQPGVIVDADAVLIDAALTTQDAEQIVKWIEATGKNLTTIYITHGRGTKAYLRDFERALAGRHSAQGLVDKMMAVHGDLGNPYTLWTAAQAVFKQRQGASS